VQSIPARAGSLLGADDTATRGFQGLALKPEVLVYRADAGVAVQGHPVGQGTSLSRWPLDPVFDSSQTPKLNPNETPKLSRGSWRAAVGAASRGLHRTRPKSRRQLRSNRCDG